MTFASCQNPARSNKFFFPLLGRYALEGFTFSLRKCDLSGDF